MPRATGRKVLAAAGRCNRSPIVRHRVVFEKIFPLSSRVFPGSLLSRYCLCPGREKKERTDESQIFVLLETIILLSYGEPQSVLHCGRPADDTFSQPFLRLPDQPSTTEFLLSYNELCALSQLNEGVLLILLTRSPGAGEEVV